MTDREIGQWLKTAREERELSCQEVGKFLGVNRSNIWRWENAKVSIPLPRLVQLVQLYRLDGSVIFK